MFTSAESIENIEKIIGELDTAVKALASTSDPLSVACVPFGMYLSIFALACFVGYCVIWNVTPSLHAPLMSVTNAISSVIIVGAILAAGQTTSVITSMFGFLAVTLASINIFGGFYVTHRMLTMFSKKEKKGGK